MEPRGLDWPLPEFERVLQRAVGLVVERYEKIDTAAPREQRNAGVTRPKDGSGLFQRPARSPSEK